ncbi:amine dehydrogenase large subunit [Pseudomonas sp. N040]|uniref:amine dehydrogenase large subunit n=1 Tax=Pseudomonas sp. N040 TaxID=2785325 RepID=UPI0018A2C974|nr:amine dehydrogenase large subunit [Pseudomonas sp. N040]MBF7729799.1 amine dehydrogenase [Pseudomonas sp. N040]MBW7013441.1 amine dehydrogenase [Pseudomonas sp. N040]
MLKRLASYFMLCGLSLAAQMPAALAEIALEQGTVEVLEKHDGQHWFWIWGNRAPSMIDGRALLFDDHGQMLGQLDTGFWFNSLLPAQSRNELFAVETYFSRGTRGERTDVVSVYDPLTLKPKREIPIPPKRINALGNTGLSVLSDDERFLLVLNYTPAQSISIIDLNADRFVGEVETPGCASVYPAGPRDFYSICGDGSFLHLRLDDQGAVLLKQRSQPLFDPLKDLFTTSASRIGDTWYFVSRENHAYAVQMTADALKVARSWSLVSDAERADDWRISGVQHTAVHAASGRLFVLMHQGGPETFQEPGTEVWVYDVQSGSKLQALELEELSISIGVSPGAQPRLYSVDYVMPMPFLATAWIFATEGKDGVLRRLQQQINLYDADSGEHLRRVDGLPYGYLNMVLPW